MKHLRNTLAKAITLLSLSLAVAADPAAEREATALLQQVQAAFASGDISKSLKLADQAVTRFPTVPEVYHVRAQIHSRLNNPAAAVLDYDALLKLDPKPAHLYQTRGEQNFMAGRIRQAIEDFDQYLKSNPKREAEHWQRGIAYYYAGEFLKGRKQFELHQTVNSQDVENAVWHFLCVARLDGVEKARQSLIPISGDARIPMKEVHDLFAGKVKPEAVLAAAEKASTPSARDRQLFYAHLYLGLYYEALGEKAMARSHIEKADADYRAHDYMGAVAHVHAEILRGKIKVDAPKSPSSP